MPTDERGYSRVDVKWAAMMHTTQGPIEGEVNNISPVGAFICCEQQPDPNETFFLIIKVSDEHLFVSATATVSRAKPNGIGVSFIEISDEDQRFLNKLVTDLFRSEFGNKFIKNRSQVKGSSVPRQGPAAKP